MFLIEALIIDTEEAADKIADKEGLEPARRAFSNEVMRWLLAAWEAMEEKRETGCNMKEHSDFLGVQTKDIEKWILTGEYREGEGVSDGKGDLLKTAFFEGIIMDQERKRRHKRLMDE